MPPTMPGITIGVSTRLKIAVLSGKARRKASARQSASAHAIERRQHTDADAVGEGAEKLGRAKDLLVPGEGEAAERKSR